MLTRNSLAVSLNEIEGLTAKAVRGAGAGWGVAEDVARAARWMARHGLDWSTPLLALLGSGRVATELAPIFEVGDGLAGLGASDVRVLDGFAPVWVLGVLSGCLYGRDHCVDVAGAEWRARLRPDGGLSASRPPRIDERGPERVTIEASETVTALAHEIVAATGRPPIPATVWHALESYAAETYVQPTLRSRLTGAGGGRVDDD